MLMDTITLLDSAGATKNVSGDAVQGGFYDVAGSTLSMPTDGAVLMRLSVTRAFTLPASLTGSYAESEVATTGAASYPIKINGSSVGSLDWASSGTIATFTFSTQQSLAIGDILTVEAPATADATHDKLCWTLAGTLA